MSEWMLKVTVFAGVLLLAGLMNLFVRYVAPRLRSREKAPEDDDCAACGSTQLQLQAPGVYRCRDCGYEGGSGRAAFEASKRAHAWEQRPFAERAAAAEENLVDARRTAAAVEAESSQEFSVGRLVENVLAQGGADEIDEGRKRHLRVVGAVLEAYDLVQVAAEKVPELTPPPLPADPNSVNTSDLEHLRRHVLKLAEEQLRLLAHLRAAHGVDDDRAAG